MGSEPAGTQTTRSMRHKERPIHRTHARLRRSVRPIGHLRANHASHQDPTLLAGVSESDRWLAAAPPRAYPLSRKTTSGELHPGGRGRGLGGGRKGRARGDEPRGLSTRCVSILNNASSGPPTTSTNTRPEGARVGFPNRAFTHPSRGAARVWGAVFRGCRFARPPAHFCDPYRDRRP